MAVRKKAEVNVAVIEAVSPIVPVVNPEITITRDWLAGLNEKTISTYRKIYEPLFKGKGQEYKNLETMCEVAWKAKEGLRKLFDIGEEGYIALPESVQVCMNPFEVLRDLIEKTNDATTKKVLSNVKNYIHENNIFCGYVHREHAKSFLEKSNKAWPDERNNVLSLTKLLTSCFDEKISQVFSKIYNKQKGTQLYLSVRPLDLLMVGDHGKPVSSSRTTGNWMSCHCTLTDWGQSALITNLNLMLDDVSFVVYAGVPEYEEYIMGVRSYCNNNTDVFSGINPASRALGWANSEALVIDVARQDSVCAIDNKVVGAYLAGKLGLLEHKTSVGSINKKNNCTKGPDAISDGGGSVIAYAKRNNDTMMVGTHKHTVKPKRTISFDGTPEHIQKVIKEYLKEHTERDPRCFEKVYKTRTYAEYPEGKEGFKNERDVWVFAVEGDDGEGKHRLIFTDGLEKFTEGDFAGQWKVQITLKYHLLSGFDPKKWESYII